MAAVKTSVSVQIGPPPAQEFADVEEYSIDSSVLTLMDTFMVRISNPGGKRSLTFKEGDPISIFMSDPRVAGGEKRKIMMGRVVDYDSVVDANGGGVIEVAGGDLGWHLVNTCGPLFKSVMTISFKHFLEIIIDPTWGFAGVGGDNEFNRRLQQGLKLNQGRAAFTLGETEAFAFVPPVCFESGEMIADKLITYARRAKRLVNVSGDGFLQIFAPNYSQAAAFTIHFHRPDEDQRRLNNVVAPIRVHRTIDGLYSDLTCTWTEAVPTHFPNALSPHDGTYKSKVSDATLLPFNRSMSFGDSDSMTQSMGNDRVLQRFQRGQFDSWVANYIVPDHVMDGQFITPDTMCGLSDTFNNEQGPRYVASRQFRRSIGSGTTTTLTLRKPNLLRA